jgi:Protein of unknown function (DUF4012)
VTQSTRTEPDATPLSREELRRRRQSSQRVVGVIALAAGIGGLFAGCHPTGTPVVDEIYGALFAVLVTLIASLASRESLLVLGAVCVAMSRGWLLVPAVVALGIGFSEVFLPSSRRRVGALVGALSSQVILRWPPIGFHGSTALIAFAALIYPSISAYTRMSGVGRRRTRRTILVVALIAVVPVILLAAVVVLARTPLSAGQQGSVAALGDVRSGTATTGAQALLAASNEFGSASSTIGSWWAEPLRIFPVFAQQRQALASGAVMAQRLDQVAAQQTSGFDLNALDVTDGQIDLSKVTALSGPTKILDAALANAQVTMAHLQSQWLVAPLQTRLDSLATKMNQARDSVDAAKRAIPLLPAMLGADAPRHYLVVFQTPSESRGLGGVITGYADLTAANGKVTLTQSGGIGDLDTALPAGGGVLKGPASFLARYGPFHPAASFQDETYAPDLPTTGQVLAQLYPQTGAENVDGVIVVDPFGLAELLKLTGPVSVPGLNVPLTSQNAPNELMKEQYILFGNPAQTGVRHDDGAAALKIIFNQLTTMTLPGPSTVSTAIDDALRGGHLGMWSIRPDEETLLSSLDAAEKFPTPRGGDLLAVTLQNAGNNNIDAYLHQSISDHVVFDPATGQTQAQVSITMTNTAPASGLPAAVIANPGAPQYPPGNNYMWMSIYTPLRLSHPSVNGVPFAMSLSPGKELGVNVYSGYVNIGPRSTGTARVMLSGTVAASPSYRLHLRVQPSANPVATTVRVTSTQNPASTSSWTAGSDVAQFHNFKL